MRWLEGLFAFLLGFTLVIAMHSLLPARDADGHYAQANPEMHKWFESLHSKGGSWCCDITDGRALQDVDWQTKDGHYEVRIGGQWIAVPDDAVIPEANRYGSAVVWLLADEGGGAPYITCFLPGAGT